MKAIDKFVLKSYVGPMVLTFFIVMFILMMNIVWRYIDELVGKGISFGVIMEFLFYSAATMIPMGIPLATLLAAIMTIGNLGENYELLAMKSAGMSLQRVMKPLIILVSVVAISSFWVANNLVPYSFKKMQSMLYDIRNQRQTIEFKDGQFFNGIPDKSIRVEKQDPKTGLLTGILIYDTSDNSGNMQTTVAESGYIRLSDDKRFLLVTLFNGANYETTRDARWLDDNVIRQQMFKRQDLTIQTEGFDFQRTDMDMFNNARTKPLGQLNREIDSLNGVVVNLTARAYEPLMKDYLLIRDQSVMGMMDSIATDYSYKEKVNLLDSVEGYDVYQMKTLLSLASEKARSSRSAVSFDEDMTKNTITELYRDEVEWHRKVSLPASIMIFFLIGAPLGAIIRKGGFGMPIVVSVLFFVVYYIISISGEKLAMEGSWNSFSGMWLSVFVLLPMAMYLTYKATNDSNLFNMDWYRNKFGKIKNKIKEKRNKTGSHGFERKGA